MYSVANQKIAAQPSEHFGKKMQAMTEAGNADPSLRISLADMNLYQTLHTVYLCDFLGVSGSSFQHLNSLIGVRRVDVSHLVLRLLCIQKFFQRTVGGMETIEGVKPENQPSRGLSRCMHACLGVQTLYRRGSRFVESKWNLNQVWTINWPTEFHYPK